MPVQYTKARGVHLFRGPLSLPSACSQFGVIDCFDHHHEFESKMNLFEKYKYPIDMILEPKNNHRIPN